MIVVKLKHHVRGWHVYISNVDKVTTLKMIEDQQSSEGIKMISCKIYEHKESAAAHVVVPFDKKDAVLNADTWTEGVRARNWSFDKSAFRKTHYNDAQKFATRTVKNSNNDHDGDEDEVRGELIEL